MRKLFFILFFAVCAHAGFFLENDAAEEEALAREIDRGFSFGGGISIAYYLSEFDLSVSGLAAYRFQNDFGIAPEISIGLNEKVYEAGSAIRYFFSEEDFVDVGATAVYFKKEGDWFTAPRIFVDYGRNMKPWPHAHFALQGKIRLSYLIGESLGREEEYVTKTASTVISGTLSLIFF